MNDAVSTPGLGAMGIVRVLTGGAALGRGSGNKKARKKLKKKISSNKKSVSGRKNG